MLKKIAFCVLTLALLAGCAAPVTTAPTATVKPLVHVKLPMGYIPNVQFTPFYTAVERGYFKDAGIEIEFDYANETDGVALVGANKLQFALVSGEQVPMARAQGLPVVYVVAWYQKYPVSIIAMSDQNIKTPADLRGKKIGVRAFSQTTGIWVRGILLDEYGVDHRDITWATQEDAHVQEYADPPNVVRIAPGQDLQALLLSGEIDAGIALTGIDPAAVRPVIADPMAAAAAWFKKTGAYPVNHLLCLKTALVEARPWLPAELMRLFVAAKAAAVEPSSEARFASIVGADVLPYGLAANRTGIELCLRYAAEQGLVPRAYAVEEIFAA